MKLTIQNGTIAATTLGTAFYCYNSKKPIVMSAILVVLAGAVGYIVGGYAETILPTKK